MAVITTSGKRGHHTRQRLYPGVKGRAPQNKTGRQADAKERLEAWSKLSPQEQLKVLDRRPGECRRQRDRINARIETSRRAPKMLDEVKVNPPEDNVLTSRRPTAKERRLEEQQRRPGSGGRA